MFNLKKLREKELIIKKLEENIKEIKFIKELDDEKSSFKFKQLETKFYDLETKFDEKLKEQVDLNTALAEAKAEEKIGRHTSSLCNEYLGHYKNITKQIIEQFGEIKINLEK